MAASEQVSRLSTRTELLVPPNTLSKNGEGVFIPPQRRVVLEDERRIRQAKKKGRPRGDIKGQKLIPPTDALRWSARRELARGKYPTPVNEHGLIVKDALYRLVKSAVRPSYRWSHEVTVHHMYDPESWYTAYPNSIAKSFRELPIHKLLVPRSFENLLHDITEPAPIPACNVMHGVVDSWKKTEKAFLDAKSVVWWEKRHKNRLRLIAEKPHVLPLQARGVDIYGRIAMADISGSCQTGLEQSLEALMQIPDEFKLTVLPAEVLNNPLAIATHLGKIVAPSAVTLTEAIPA